MTVTTVIAKPVRNSSLSRSINQQNKIIQFISDHKHFGGDIFYAAGSMVVRYNCEENVQKSFYCAKKAVSSIALCTLKIVSFESISFKSYIAIAERGPSPTISIWDVESAVLIKELNQVHKYGIG